MLSRLGRRSADSLGNWQVTAMQMVITVIVTVIIFAPLTIWLNSRHLLESQSARMVRRAKSAGRVAKGILVFCERETAFSANPPGSGGHTRNRLWKVRYRYSVQEVNYEFAPFRVTMKGDCRPPENITLYYPPGKPEKAVPENYKIPVGSNYFLLALLLLVFFSIVYRFLGQFF